jgi:hypothetical protein
MVNAPPGLFDEASPRSDEVVRSQNCRIEVAALALDFAQPSAPRLAAAAIFALADVEARRAALANVPEDFREMVRLMVERAFYNARQGVGK